MTSGRECARRTLRAARASGSRRALAAWIAAAGLAVLPAACGGTDVPANLPPGGKTFASEGCGGCHRLEAAGGRGAAGPNLDARRPSAARVRAIVTQGAAGMPAYGDRLSRREIDELASFVAANAGR